MINIQSSIFKETEEQPLNAKGASAAKGTQTPAENPKNGCKTLEKRENRSKTLKIGPKTEKIGFGTGFFLFSCVSWLPAWFLRLLGVEKRENQPENEEIGRKTGESGKQDRKGDFSCFHVFPGFLLGFQGF